ncbi:hypothetical protein [Salinispora oceanensis]|uniref:hypothetical protein n=1 Tax=Salinispora oceanensis TaxID=1050199 RepID=UPI00037E9795|nr:hypothetical protein [Salinispora oceanensis]
MTFPHPRRRVRRALGLSLALMVAVTATAPGAASAGGPRPSAPDFGPNVTIFSPETPTDEIQATMDARHAAQVDAEMGTDRHAYLFLPGEYGSADQPLQVKLGYYTQVSGLGATPTDVQVDGKIEVYNRCLDDEGTSNCLALVNFWRTLSNLALRIDPAGQDDCRSSANFWAVSQAVSMRRLDVTGGTLSLMDYCTAGPQYASGGFIADSRLPEVVNGSQQQWLTRNSEIDSWSNGVWNQVFTGVDGAPADDSFPDPPYTTLDTTPLSREKPYLFVDDRGRYQVRVPAARRDTRGVSWATGTTPGRTIPIRDFHIARPGDSVRTINRELARGKHLLLTPGRYDIARSIEIRRPDTVVLGLGHATLTAVDGATPLNVAGVPGVVVAGVTIDAGLHESPVLLRVGKRHGRNHSTPQNPITLSDVYFRVGGPHIGRTHTALEVNADDVLIDHTWVWRGDHGVEDFTEGVKGDTDRWRTNTGRYGAIINGDRVTATGLFVEHFQRHNTVWNGEHGTTILYQNELPYDPPTQADWMKGEVQGWAGYKVNDRVRHHTLYSGGVYVYNRNNPSIHTENGFEVPDHPGVQLHRVMTVNLNAGTIDHVVNGIGAAADTTRVGQPVYLTKYPVD